MNTNYLKALTCRVALATLTVTILSLPAAANTAVYDQFKVPTFETSQLTVYGQDLFSYDDSGALNVNVGSDYLINNQNPMDSLYIHNNMTVDAGKFNSDADFTYDIHDTLKGEYKKWLGDPKGLAIIAGGALHFGYGSETDMSLAIEVEAGAQFGRMLDARAVAQAAAMFSALEMDATDEQLLAVAEIIGNQASYTVTHRDEGTQMFFNDLAKAVGTDNPFKLAEVLNSPLYNIGVRATGWEVGAVADFATGDHGGDAAGQDLDAVQFFNMGMMLDANMGVWVKESFTYGIMTGPAGGGVAASIGEGNMKIAAELGFNLDHSLQWNSQLVANIDVMMPDGGDMMLGWAVHGETNYAMGTNTFVGAYLNVCGGEGAVTNAASICTGDDELHYGVGANFTYYVW